MTISSILSRAALLLPAATPQVQADDLAVKITPHVAAADVQHAGETVRIQPVSIADGVQTSGEIRMLGYPPGKLKWYRGGMQNRDTPGLASVKP